MRAFIFCMYCHPIVFCTQIWKTKNNLSLQKSREIIVYFSDEVFSLSMPSVCPHLTTGYSEKLCAAEIRIYLMKLWRCHILVSNNVVWTTAFWRVQIKPKSYPNTWRLHSAARQLVRSNLRLILTAGSAHCWKQDITQSCSLSWSCLVTRAKTYMTLCSGCLVNLKCPDVWTLEINTLKKSLHPVKVTHVPP